MKNLFSFLFGLLFLITFPITKAENKDILWDLKDYLSKEDFEKTSELLKRDDFFELINSLLKDECDTSLNPRKCAQRYNQTTIEKWEVNEVCRNSKIINKLGPQLPFLGGMLTARNLYDSLDFLAEYFYDELELNTEFELSKDEIKNLIKQFKLIEFAKLECPEEITN